MAALDSFTELIRTAPRYFDAKSDASDTCKATLATVRFNATVTSVWLPVAARDFVALPDMTNPPARLALVVTSANVPL